jgi:heme exporter protein D
MRDRNKIFYRVAHWPIWIWVFFLAPGSLTFNLFAAGGSTSNLVWLAVVLALTAIAGLFGQLPGVEQRPYILRFCEDKPNPLYRKICYTFAWNALLNFAALNLIGLFIAAFTGQWRMQQIYSYCYFPLLAIILACGFYGVLPRVKASTKGEGFERRYFYGAVWSITSAQLLLLLMWKVLPRGHATDMLKLFVYVFVLLVLGAAGTFGLLPRTRPILPGELMVAD